MFKFIPERYLFLVLYFILKMALYNTYSLSFPGYIPRDNQKIQRRKWHAYSERGDVFKFLSEIYIPRFKFICWDFL